MEFGLLDISVFLLFIIVVVGTSMYKSRKVETGENFFLASRGLIWPLIGLSLIAANISTEQFVGMSGQSAGSVGLEILKIIMTIVKNLNFILSVLKQVDIEYIK